MTLTAQQVLRRHGALPAAATALSVGALLVVAQVLQILIVLTVTATTASSGGDLVDLQPVVQPFPVLAVALTLAATILPFTLGFFVSLWIVAPIAADLRIGIVIVRAMLATGIGSILWFVGSVIAVVIQSITLDGALLGSSFPTPGFEDTILVQGLLGALRGALSAFIVQLPLGVLAGVLLWLWRKDRAPRHPLSGLVDEV